ncbi:MAG: long-chain-fatty-acid--CoA ligase [Candidatus Lokiarchaeota archaeon]|nr:long-chain-fatty-acid--CoA ligase [Candidatus Lokiarchaeota archaeon]
MHIGKLLKSSAKNAPENIGLVFEEEEISFSELNQIANILANVLKEEFDIKKGDRIATLMDNSVISHVSYFSLPKIGAILIPYNYKMSKEELEYCTKDSMPKMIIYDSLRYSKEIDHIKKTCDVEFFLSMDDIERLIKDSKWIQEPKVKVKIEDVAYILYTGGTTGFPKGVLLSHKNLISTLINYAVSEMESARNHIETNVNADNKNIEELFDESNVVLTSLPIFHIAALAGVLAAMIARYPLILMARFDKEKFLRYIEKYKVTNVLIVPTIFQYLLEDKEYLKKFDLSSLKTIMYGASPVSPTTLLEALRTFKGINFIQIFAQTESSPSITRLGPSDHIKALENPDLLKSAGKAVKDVEIKIVDPETDEELGRGQVGEVCARGPGVMKGYWNQPLKTEETLKGGWLHTGDLGKLDEEGYLFIVDRCKDMIVSGGENIYPKEVENVIYKLPEVKLCAVIGAPDPKWQERVVAYVVPKDGSNLKENDIINYCKEHLARYKAPKEVIFKDELPLSPQGKILKRVLKDMLWEGRERRIV